MNFVFNKAKVIDHFSPLDEVFSEADCEQGLENLYSLESIGIKNNDLSSSDEAEVEKFKQSIELRDNKYYIKMPWKEDVIKKVPHNFELCQILAKKVSRDNMKVGINEQYLRVFEEQLAMDIIEEIPIDSNFDFKNHVWIPHRPIHRVDPLVNSTKIRPVFNASLKIKDLPSLNEAAFAGIDIMNSLLGLLNYFRTNKIAMSADLRKAFLMIKLKDVEDKNRFSFLVYSQGNYRAYRYSSLIFGFVASPFILNYILRHHAEKCQNSLLKDVISNKFYVDNLIFTTNSENVAVDLHHNITHEMNGAGFEFHEWATNDLKVSSCIPEESKLKTNLIKLLGYVYDSDLDVLKIKNVEFNPNPQTKRELVSNLYRVFDPLGLISPILINCKCILREVNSSKVQWDEKLPPNILQSWKKFTGDLGNYLDSFAVKRNVLNSDLPVDLYVFVDASTQAYGFCCYAVQGSSCNLMFSKVKLSPLAKKSLPTLELLSAFLALQCLISITEDKNFNVSVNSINILTDSQVSLSWLLTGNAHRKHVFVNNRLKDIKSFEQQFSKNNVIVKYNYIPTKFNIADLITRPCSLSNFIKNKDLWLFGPEWILKPSTEWPTGNLGCFPTEFLPPKLIANINVNPEPDVLNIESFSSYSKLIGVVTKLMEAKNKFLKKAFTLEQCKQQAFNYLVLSQQEKYYPDVINFLKSESNDLEPPLIVSQLNLFRDDQNLIRSRGRVEKSNFLSYDSINPVLVHQKSHLAHLFIKFVHSEVKHLGVNFVLNSLRRRGIWIPKARSSIFSILGKCIVCKKYNSRHFPLPPTPSLPVDKVKLMKPFSTVGIDYTGHVFVNDNFGEKQKMYILIFACFQTRAIHLELLKSMNLEQFLLAFIRFCNRFGIPSVVYSDNAKTFLAGSSVLSNIIESDEFSSQFKANNIKFKTSPTYSPWYGGNWERLLRTVKSCLYKTIGRTILDYFSLLTMLSDVQNVINNRPLTYRTKENELDILTPNHFISFGNNFPSLVLSEERSDNEDLDIDVINENLIGTIECRDVLFSRFKERWYHEYLLSLRSQHYSNNPIRSFKNSPYLKEGSVVIMKDPVKSKHFWHLCKIIKITKSSDGNIRSVTIKKHDNSEVVTSISNLYPLELFAPVGESLPSNDPLCR